MNRLAEYYRANKMTNKRRQLFLLTTQSNKSTDILGR